MLLIKIKINKIQLNFRDLNRQSFFNKFKKMEVFDIFVRRYETNEPLITLTVSPVHTVGKIKKMFAENCMLIKKVI